MIRLVSELCRGEACLALETCLALEACLALETCLALRRQREGSACS